MKYSIVLLLVIVAFFHQSVSVLDCWRGAEFINALDDCTEAYADFSQALGDDGVVRVFVFRKITRFSRRPSNSLYGHSTVDMARIGLTRQHGHCDIEMVARNLVLSNRSGKQKYFITTTADLMDRVAGIIHQCVEAYGVGGIDDGYAARGQSGPSLSVTVDITQPTSNINTDLLSTGLSDILGMEGMDGGEGAYCETNLKNCNTGFDCQEQPTRRSDVFFGTLALKVVEMCMEISASGISG